MTHICVDNLTTNASDNGLSPGRNQASIWTNAGIVLIGPLGTNFNEILVEVDTFSFRKRHLKMSSGNVGHFVLNAGLLAVSMTGHWRCYVTSSVKVSHAMCPEVLPKCHLPLTTRHKYIPLELKLHTNNLRSSSNISTFVNYLEPKACVFQNGRRQCGLILVKCTGFVLLCGTSKMRCCD